MEPIGNFFVGIVNVLRETHFGVGLMGIKKEDVDKVEKITQETLEKICINNNHF